MPTSLSRAREGSSALCVGGERIEIWQKRRSSMIASSGSGLRLFSILVLWRLLVMVEVWSALALAHTVEAGSIRLRDFISCDSREGPSAVSPQEIAVAIP